MQKHFPACVKKNGNPNGLRWNDTDNLRGYKAKAIARDLRPSSSTGSVRVAKSDEQRLKEKNKEEEEEDGEEEEEDEEEDEDEDE